MLSLLTVPKLSPLLQICWPEAGCQLIPKDQRKSRWMEAAVVHKMNLEPLYMSNFDAKGLVHMSYNSYTEVH